MKLSSAIIVFGLLASNAFVTADARSDDSSPFPLIVAHRGASADRPECTLSAIRRAIEVGAHVVEIDVRTSKEGVLFLLHDSTLDRTTDGTGPANKRTMAELKELDAGGWFNEAYRSERIPTLGESLEACRGKIDVLLDLKATGETYAKAVADDVRTHGDPARTIFGVRSVEQAGRFRRLLPGSRQLGFIPDPKSIEAFAEAGVETIRLWPRWVTAGDGASLVERVRNCGARIQLNGTVGTPQEVLPLLQYRPDALLVDDPDALKATLDECARHMRQFDRLLEHVEVQAGATVVPWVAKPEAATFLNREYHMFELPDGLCGQARLMFAGGEGDRVRLRFKKSAVVFAAFEYNSTGAWSFPEGYSPNEFGWRLMKKHGYRGTSNAIVEGKPHYANVYCRTFEPDEQLTDMPPWWLCLAIVGPRTASDIDGFTQAMSADSVTTRPFLYSQWATNPRPLCIPEFESPEQWAAWQRTMRDKFRQRLVFGYGAPPTIVNSGEQMAREGFAQQELHVLSDGRLLFRFFKLTPDSADRSTSGRQMPTIVCFMGHGKVRQILDEPDSYQHACAARFAKCGYLVFAMENIGMGPSRDTHHELDRLLRLDGYGWYSLLFAHQQILLDHVFAHAMVDSTKVGVTGVSTGGLLAITAIAMDPRVTAASVQGIFGSMRVSFIRDRNRHCPCGAIPGLLPEFNLPELALLATPRPLHISNAIQDGFGPEEAKRQIERITLHYRRAGGKEPLFSSPPGRHEYAFDPALKFFEDSLGKP